MGGRGERERKHEGPGKKGRKKETAAEKIKGYACDMRGHSHRKKRVACVAEEEESLATTEKEARDQHGKKE